MSEQSNSSSKRKHIVEEQNAKKLSTESAEEPLIKSEKMDTNNGETRGKGRGLLFERLGVNKNLSKRPIGGSKYDKIPDPQTDRCQRPSGSLIANVVDDCPDDEESQKRLREAERKTGLTYDIFEEYFKIDGNVSALMEKKGYNLCPTVNPWLKQEVKVEVKEEDDVNEKKIKDKKLYVEKAKENEKKRIIQQQKEAEKKKLAESPTAGPSGRNSSADASHPLHNMRRHANRPLNASQLSLTTDIESVGTFMPMMQDVAEEDPRAESLVDKFFKTRPKRTPLPIRQYEEKIISSVNANRVVIIEGATGCGKTTQVPQYIADDYATKGLPFNIVVTQPRRIAAKSIANRVASERGWELGSIVGYQIGMDRTHVNEDTRILYCTTGVLLQRLINMKRMDMYSHIIIDEVHERGIETDLLLLVIKKLMTQTGVSVKIILMSATFDVTKLVEYFSIPVYSMQNEEEVTYEVKPTHIKVEERPNVMNTFFIDEIKKDLKITTIPPTRFDPIPFDKDNPCVSADAMDVAEVIIDKGLEVFESQIRGSVLVFLPGLEEIHEMKSRLDKNYSSKAKHWKVYPLHSSVPLDKQNEIFRKPYGHERKIILATNIAESSITVPDVEYVIDFCLTKNLVCDLETHIPVLRMEWAAKSNCDQRAGRCGRVKEGRVYRLIPKPFYATFSDYGYPELIRSPLDLSILRVKMLNMGPPKELLALALDPPDLSDIYRSVLQLKQVGAFAVRLTTKNGSIYDEEDGDLTTLGIIMSRLPIDIRLAKLVVMGHVFDVLQDCITIAACLSTQGMFRRDFSQGLQAFKSRLAWADRSFSDSIAFLNAYKMYDTFRDAFGKDKKLAEKWCKQNYLQYKRILEVEFMIGDIKDRLRYENIQIPERPNYHQSRNERELIVKIVMCAAFYPNYFLRNEIDAENIPKSLSTHDPYNTVAINQLPQNQGVIYAPQIRQLFSICSNQIDLNFEDTKAYVSFVEDKHPLKEVRYLLSNVKNEDDGRETAMSSISDANSSDTTTEDKAKAVLKELNETAIKTAVYVAIAMRSHREVNKEVMKYNPLVTKSKMDRIDRVKKEEFEKWRTFHSHRISVPSVLPRVKLEKLRLPAMDCSEIPILVTHVVNPGLFYAQYYNKITDDAINKLSHLINYDVETVRVDDSSLRFGDIVIAQYCDSNGSKVYGRARVQSIEYRNHTKEIEKVLLFFIDFGLTKHFDNLNEMNAISAKSASELLTMAPVVFECHLSEVMPNPVTSSDGCWNKKSIEFFKKFVKKHKSLTGKIYSIVNRVVRLELFEDENREMSFNQRLISSGFAEKYSESCQSSLNHDQRRNAILRRKSDGISFRLEEIGPNPGVYDSEDVIQVDFVDLEDEASFSSNSFRSHDKFSIKGPFSPLECSFTGLTKQTSNRAVRIERDSVNCVVLEPDYLSKHTRLLVASNIGLGQSTGNINLRNTTLMPNIRGFPALMALLFSPRAQFRVDKEKTQYVGAICGLGFDPNTNKGYDIESDAEIIFDTEISREDVAKVNVIRYHMSDLLKSREQLREFADGTLALKQRKIRRLVIELLDRRRRLLNIDNYNGNYKWGFATNDVNAGFDNTQRDGDEADPLLPIINPLQMDDYDWFEDIKLNLKQLKEVQNGRVSMITKCKLCKFSAYTIHDITFHLTSNEHIDKVIDFNQYFKINEDDKLKEMYYETKDDTEVIDCFDSDDD